MKQVRKACNAMAPRMNSKNECNRKRCTFWLLSFILIGQILLMLSSTSVYADERDVEITDLKASDGSKVEVVDSLKVGDLLLTDRNYTITAIPDKYLSLPWIRTANNSKKVEKVVISFNIDREANIYIVWDPGAPERDWLISGYTLTTDIINTTDAPKKIYKSNQPFPPGEVKTYEAMADAGFYVIIVEGTGKGMDIECSGKLAQTWGCIKVP